MIGTTTQRGISRREALRRFLAGAGSYVVLAGPGALAQDTSGTDAPAEETSAGLFSFPQGVASGDPQPDGVVLWTRVVRAGELADAVSEPRPIFLTAEVARDPDFTQMVAVKAMSATPESDFTVRLFVSGLEPATTYYYRFKAGVDVSAPLGRTRTAPEPGDDTAITLATVSCQNFQAGTYASYRRMIADDMARPEAEQIDAVMHLGDFIYEAIYTDFDEDGRVRQVGAREVPYFPGRSLQDGEAYAVSLEDYRHLYKVYLSDPDLIAARARWPFVCIWDDHEFTNDNWQTFDTYGRIEGPGQSRKVVSNQAWFEYIPALLTGAKGPEGVDQPAQDFTPVDVSDAEPGPVDPENRPLEPNTSAALGSMTIYRCVRLGRNVELVMTDARSYRSDHAIPERLASQFAGSARNAVPIKLLEVLDLGRDANDGNPPETIEYAGQTYPNPRREAPRGTMLGPDQKAWWKQTMAASDAVWKIWASSVPALAIRLDFSQVSSDIDDVVFSADAWDGYPSERRELLSYLREQTISNVIVVSGDHHASFAGTLAPDFGTKEIDGVAVEFSTTGVSSSTMYDTVRSVGNERFQALVSYRPWTFSGRIAEPVENLNTTVLYGTRTAAIAAYSGSLMMGLPFRNPRQNAHLSHMDSNSHGFCVLSIDGDEARAEHVKIAPPTDPDRTGEVPVLSRLRYRLARWGEGERPSLQGPEIIGTPPFPLRGGDKD